MFIVFIIYLNICFRSRKFIVGNKIDFFDNVENLI